MSLESAVGLPVDLPPLGERNAVAALRGGAARHPDKLAVRDPERSLSYAALYREAMALGGGFDRLGVGRQEPVLLMLDNHLDYVSCWLALSLTARVEVPVNTAYRGSILAHVVNNCGARVLVIDAPYLERIAAIADQLGQLECVIVRGDAGSPALPAHVRAIPFAELRQGPAAGPAEVAPSDLIGIMYTSGTTGLSKGVRVTHAHAYGYAAPGLFGAARSTDTTLVLLPLFHVGGQWQGVYNALIAGATAVVLPRFSASSFWDEVRRYGCTWTMLLGAMANILYRQPPAPDDGDHPLKRILMIPVMPEVEAFRTRFGMEAVGTGFGSTEGSTIMRAPPGLAVPDAVGWLRPDFEARLVDESDIEVPDGRTGELVIRAREPWCLMDGYHGMPEATVAAWRNLWFHTGDVMRQLPSGQYQFVDRAKDAMRRRGENVSSFEVEREILAHPRVLECAVIAVPSELSEDDIKACVVCKPGMTVEPAELLDFLLPRMPDFMVPRYVELLDALPKTPTEKIRKQELRASGVTPATWDREAAGFTLRRRA
ncbi:AMP-binding protein [Chelatococcus reniformis]|uniref:ATP-dependent acyl-CoA ligase n=1 Tax=Chelatococcus reniformis TaxID=1494448 RepID=A0A916U6X9_9HYPH|nr:AMP-binding protein [Chelatococcus reniformis]GGC61665.1 ATP-dependent acyl-CoA ligase [Chelatococcus reniformis]